MGKIIDKTITKIVTEEGISLFRRVTKVLMPNGKYRYPVDYFDATPGVVKVSKEEMDKVAIPVYKKLIYWSGFPSFPSLSSFRAFNGF